MLILLQPGIEPLGQFDIEDDDVSSVVGGEVGIFQAASLSTDGYAADVFPGAGPKAHVALGSVATHGTLFGLIDEGTSGGSADTNRGYGTSFGTVIGGTAGQGTGMGALSTTGAVVIGPNTMLGSGKVTLWTKPGLYGTTLNAWVSSAEFDAATVNTGIYGDASGTDRGKLTTTVTGVKVAIALGTSGDPSLVSTTTTAAGGAATVDYMVVYLAGVQF